MSDIRDHGYAVFPLDAAGARFREALSELANDVLSDRLRSMALELLSAVHHATTRGRNWHRGARSRWTPSLLPSSTTRSTGVSRLRAARAHRCINIGDLARGRTTAHRTARVTHRTGGIAPEGS